MIYVAKFCTQWILPPGCLIVLLLAAGFFLVRCGRKGTGVLLFLMALGLWGLSIRPGANALCVPLENTFPRSGMLEAGDCDCLILTGAGAVRGVPDLGGTGQPSGTMACSMLVAFRIAQRTGLPLIVTGGRVNPDSEVEAETVVRILKDMGIPEARLFAETQSRTTIENARNSLLLARDHGWQHPLLLVPALHSLRAARVFHREGLSCDVFPTMYRRSRNQQFSLYQDLLPGAGNFHDSCLALKEYLGLWALSLKLQ